MSEMKCSDYLKELQKETGYWNAWMWLPLPPDEIRLRMREAMREVPRLKDE